MHTVDYAASLMDNAEFYEELGKLEALPDEDTSDFPEPTAPIDRVRHTPAAITRGRRPAAEARGLPPRFIMPRDAKSDPIAEASSSLKAVPTVKVAPIRKAAKPAAVHPTVAVVGFLLMVLVGAGAAVLVFHDRVEQIVVQWQAAGR